MLLVVGAQTTIVGTTPVVPSLSNERTVARLQVGRCRLEVFGVGRHTDFLRAMFRTALEIEDITFLLDDLRGNQFKTLPAKRCRLTEEQIGNGFTLQHGVPLLT